MAIFHKPSLPPYDMKLRKLINTIFLCFFDGAESAEAKHLYSFCLITHEMFCEGG